MPSQQTESAAARALEALTTMPPDICVPLPPRRLPLSEGMECLVQWRPGNDAGKWHLNLTKRAEAPDDTTVGVETFRAEIDLATNSATIDRTDGDAPFFAWVDTQLSHIADDIRARQEQERPALMARAQISAGSMTIRDFIPHIIILIALAAFAYMFAVVHIKF